MAHTTDRELAAQFAAGDVAAVQRVVDQHQEPLTRLVVRLLGWNDRAAADDLVQEVFVRAIESRQQFNGTATLTTWLTRIAINQCRAHVRKQQRRRVLLRWWHATSNGRHQHPATQPTEQQETAEHVRDAVASLAPNYREVVVLYYLQQLPIEQVADLLGIKPGTAHTRLSRARNELRKLLDESLYFD